MPTNNIIFVLCCFYLFDYHFFLAVFHPEKKIIKCNKVPPIMTRLQFLFVLSENHSMGCKESKTKENPYYINNEVPSVTEPDSQSLHDLPKNKEVPSQQEPGRKQLLEG